MANIFQRVIYHISNTVPLLLMTGLVWYIQNKNWMVPLILFAIAIFITTIFAICFIYGKSNVQSFNINVTSISSNDSWLAAYVIAYLLPFAKAGAEISLTVTRAKIRGKPRNSDVV